MTTFKNENSKYPFIALVPMGGESEGIVAHHGTYQTSKEMAISWAEERFNRPAVVVSKDEYPELFEEVRYTGPEDAQLIANRERDLKIYQTLLNQ